MKPDSPPAPRRREPYRRDPDLERSVRELAALLEPAEGEIRRRFDKPRRPIIFVVGCARSGSTLLMQWLARSNRFAYPTNLLSRFYSAPYVGALVQQILTDLDPQSEFEDLTANLAWRSKLGKTHGMLAPNEFWYFWRRFFPEGDTHAMSEAERSEVDGAGFLSDLAALESIFDKPFAMKGLRISFDIPFVNELIPKALFIHLRRHPLYTAQSLLEARREFYGDDNAWYSFRTPSYHELRQRSPEAQVVGQVLDFHRHVSQAFESLPNERHMTLDYESFCREPLAAEAAIRERLERQDSGVDTFAGGPQGFSVANHVRLPPEQADLLKEEWRRASGQEVEW